jgi:hypothetical protein
MYKALSFFAAVLFIMSCNEAPKKEEIKMEGPQVTAPVDSLVKNVYSAPIKDSANANDEDVFNLDKYLVANAPDNDVTTISKICALIIYPTQKQADKLKNEIGGEDFATTADDYAFYQSQYLDAATKRNIETPDIKTRYIKFVGNAKTVVLDRCAKVSAGWMVILFRPDSLPRISGGVEADTAFVHYFGK